MSWSDCEHTLQVVWKAVDDALIEELVAFWTAHKALPEEAARRRAPEAVVLARDAAGTIIAVSTAMGAHSPQLGRKFWFTRVLVAEAARRQRLAMETFAAARDVLEAAFVSGEDLSCIGIIVEVESPVLKAYRNQAVWQTGPVFFGRNARGDHLRVYYFKGAVIS